MLSVLICLSAYFHLLWQSRLVEISFFDDFAVYLDLRYIFNVVLEIER